MKKLFALMLAFCLVLTILPAPAFAEGEPEAPVCTCETACTAEKKNTACPVCGAEGASPESCGKYDSPEPERPQETEKPVTPEEPEKPAEPTPAQKVQVLIDALPETVTAENRAEVEAQLTAIDEAKAPLGDEALAALDLGKYNAAVAAINALDGTPGAEVPETLVEKTLQELIDEATAGATVKLEKDYEISTSLTISKSLTLDLNGHVIKMTGSGRVVEITAGTVTLKDSASTATHSDASLPAGGVITGGNVPYNPSGIAGSGGGIDIRKNAALVMEGGTITLCKAPLGGGIGVGQNANFTMSGGAITNCEATDGGDGGGVFVYINKSFTMTGGKISDCTARNGSGVYVSGAGKFAMRGGTISCNSNETVYIRQAEFTMAGDASIESTSGGTTALVIQDATMYANGGTVTGKTFVSSEKSDGKITRSDNVTDYTTFNGEVTNNGTIDDKAKLTVTLDPLNGQEPTTQKVLKGQKVSKPADPTWDGDVFTGWHVKNVDGQCTKEPYDFDTPVMDAIYLHAHWAYQVTYLPGRHGEGTISPGTKIKDESLTLSTETFTRTGYTQTGWATSDGGEKAYDLGGTYAENAALTLYPVWKAKTYTVTFDPDGGTGTMADQTLTYDKPEKLTKNAFTRTGYTFNGWKDQTGTTYYDEEEVAHPDPSEKGIYLYAQWKLNSYTISFDANGGEGTMDTIPMTYDKAANLTANVFTRTGYTFTGWNTQADGTGTGYTDGQEVTNLTAQNGETVTLYAQWKAHSYTISFHANGGKGDMTKQTMTYGKTANLTALGFTREGYRFTGWTTKADGTGLLFDDEEQVSNLTSADGGTIDLYAQWVKVIDRVDLALSGHEIDKRVEGVKLTSEERITFNGAYGSAWGIATNKNTLKTLEGKVFQADTQYYLWVIFSPEEGCTLEGLTAKDVTLDGNAALSLEDMQGSKMALFRLPVIYTITVTAGKNGSVSSDSTINAKGVITVFEGEDVTIKITPDSGYVVYRLTVDGENVKTARTYTFEDIQQSHTLKARFLKNGTNAKTGDSFPLAPAIAVLALSAAALAAIFVITKKKKKK